MNNIESPCTKECPDYNKCQMYDYRNGCLEYKEYKEYLESKEDNKDN